MSIITTTFTDGPDRHKAFGAWAAVGGLASAVGVLLGGVLTEGPGWRWVMFINPVICAILLPAIYALIPDDRPAVRRRGFDLVGTVLATGAMLLLVYTLVEAPDRGWDATRTIAGLAGTVALTALFIWVESRTRNPLVPFTIFQVRGLAAANITQFVAFAGFISMFFFLSLYMQGILGFSPIQTGLAYLPVCVVIGISAGIATALIAKVGTRVLVVAGGLVTAVGVYLFSFIRVDGTYASDLLPGMIVMSLGIGFVFVALINAANAGVPEQQAGLAAALLNSSQQVGGALGLAVLSAIATSRTNSLLEGSRRGARRHGRGIPAGSAGRRDLPRRRRRDRPAYDQHPRAAGGGMIERVSRVVSIVFGGIFTGFLITVLVLELSLRRFDASVYTQVRQVELDRLDTLATATLLPTAVATIVLVCLGLKWGTPGVGLHSVALVLLLVVLIVTVVINLPINADQRDWSIAHPPSDWTSDRDRWQVAHVVRTMATVIAYGCLIAASGMHRLRRAAEPEPASVHAL